MTHRSLVAASAIGIAVVFAYLHVLVSPRWVFTAVVCAGAAAWFMPLTNARRGYAALLSVQAWIGAAGRVAFADLLMLPAIVKSAIAGDAFRQFQRSTLRAPLLLLIAVFAVATVVGFAETRSLTAYVLVNKDAGLLFLVAGFIVLNAAASIHGETERMLDWFVIGVSGANIVSLAAAVLAFAGVENNLYLVGNMRLYGPMLSPNRFGDIVAVAALIEIAAVGSPRVPRPWWRRTNLVLLGVGLAMTVSRSSWLAVSAGAATLLILPLTTRVPRPTWQRALTPAVWFIVPVVTLAALARHSTVRGGATTADAYAAQLRERLVDACRSDPTLEICLDVRLSTNGSPPAVRGGNQPPDLLPNPTAQHATTSAVERSLTNTRGVEDRLAILGIAFREYSRTPWRMLVGIGLGTFYARSASVFGLPLIIHNTFAWLLVEMGPLGLVAIVWVWFTIGRDLWRACNAVRWADWAAPALLAAFASVTVFCLLNEGLYQRHVWLLFALSHRLSERAA